MLPSRRTSSESNLTQLFASRETIPTKYWGGKDSATRTSTRSTGARARTRSEGETGTSGGAVTHPTMTAARSAADAAQALEDCVTRVSLPLS